MKIYVASKWEEKNNVRKLMDKIEELGHEITEDWTKHTGFKTIEDFNYYALKDYMGVISSDLFIGLFNKELSYCGSLTELGIAIGNGKKIWIIGNAIDKCLFLNLPQVTKFKNTYGMLESLQIFPHGITNEN